MTEAFGSGFVRDGNGRLVVTEGGGKEGWVSGFVRDEYGRLVVAGAGGTTLLTTSGVGDNATDNGPLLKAALTAGKKASLASGTFLVKTPVIDSIAGNSEPWVIEGMGAGTVLKLGTGLPTCSGFFGSSFNPGDVSAVWAFFLNTLDSALVTTGTAAAWGAATVYAAGNIVTDGAGHLFSATTGGQSGGGAPIWKTVANETTTDGTVVWTCMGSTSAIDCGRGATQRNSASGALARFPRLVFKNLVLDGGGLNAGFVFGNGAVPKFEDVIFQNWKFGTSGTGYADSPVFRDVQGAAPANVGTVEGSWLDYSTTNGDEPRFDRVKLFGKCGHYIGQFAAGIKADGLIGGGFWLKDCQGVELDGWHAEMTQGENNQLVPALRVNRSIVSGKSVVWKPGNIAGYYFCEINDDNSDIFQGSHLDLEGCTPMFQYLGKTDYGRVADIYIAAANDGMTITQRNPQAGAAGFGNTSLDPDCIYIDSAVEGIVNALANPTYPAAKSALAGLSTDGILHKRNGAWTWDAHASLPGLRSFVPQATPSALTLQSMGTLLPAITGIETTGTEWKITFASAHNLSATNKIVVSGFEPTEYNGTLTVASIVSSTVVAITNATKPGAITTTGTSCTTGNVAGTLTAGSKYDYAFATIDDDGLRSSAVAANIVCPASSSVNAFGLITAPGTSLVICRKKGSAGTSLSEPEAFQIIPFSSLRPIVHDTGSHINGKAWLTESVPVPNTAFATTTSNRTRQSMNGVEGLTVVSSTSPAVPTTPVLGSLTAGTDTFFASGKLFVAGLWLPANKEIIGIKVLIGSVGGTNRLVVQLHDALGNLLAKSTVESEGTLAGEAANFQSIPFTAPYSGQGPALYYVGVSGNGGTAKFRSIPATVGTSCEELSQTKATPAAIVAPTTFVGSKGPIAFVY